MSEQPIPWATLSPAQRDQLVHTKVMHAPLVCADHPVHLHLLYQQHNGFLVRDCICGLPDEEHDTTPAPAYTTSMDAIKLLRQQMAQRFPLLNLHMVVYTYNRCYAAFSLDRPVDGDEWSEGNGDYCMEDATCRAACRACGVMIE